MAEEENTKPYREGENAYENNGDEHENPYCLHCCLDKYLSWKKGFNDAQVCDDDDIPF